MLKYGFVTLCVIVAGVTKFAKSVGVSCESITPLAGGGSTYAMPPYVVPRCVSLDSFNRCLNLWQGLRHRVSCSEWRSLFLQSKLAPDNAQQNYASNAGKSSLDKSIGQYLRLIDLPASFWPNRKCDSNPNEAEQRTEKLSVAQGKEHQSCGWSS